MATINFQQSSLLSAGGQTYSLSTLLNLPASGLPAVLAIRAYDRDVVTRTDYVDSTPNHATPEEIAALAKSLIGQVWNSQGCWLLASNVSAAAGASLPVASAYLDNANIGGNGQWQVVYNGASQT